MSGVVAVVAQAGGELGPFPGRQAAVIELKRYIKVLKQHESRYSSAARRVAVVCGAWEQLFIGTQLCISGICFRQAVRS